jgi:hypothetical protein
LEAIKNTASAIEFANESLRNDFNFNIQACTINSNVYYHIKDTLKNNLQFVQELHKKDESFYKWSLSLNEKHRKDKTFMKEVVKIRPWTVNSFLDEFGFDKKFFLESLENSGYALRYSKNKKEFTADKDIMLAAVEIQGDYALKYIDKSLKKDPEFVRKAKAIIDLMN